MYKVMIVDDEMLVRIGIKSLINWQEMGFEIVAEAGNGQVAYEKYLALKPDFVITDIKMPKQDGLWLAKKIKEDNPKTEIIFLTCYDDFSYAKEAIKLRVSDYILKAEMEEEELREILLEKKKKLDLSVGETDNTEKQKFLVRKKQEYLLGLLLSNNRSVEFVHEEFVKEQVAWNSGKYCFLQFDFKVSLKDEKNTKDQIANIISACLELIINKFSEEDSLCFAKQFGKSITCFWIGSNINEIKVQRNLDYLQNSIKQYFNLGFKSANSPIADTIEEARKYAGWIFEASDYLFYLSNGDHLTKETMQRQEGLKLFYESNRVKELNKYIEEADTEAIHKQIEEIAKMMDANRANPLDVKLELTHMFNDIVKRFDMYVQKESKMINFQKKVMRAEELNEVVDILREFIKNLLEEILDSRIDNSDLLIKKAVKYIDDNYAEKISLEDIAGYVGISKYYFSVLFKKEQNITFSSYLNSVRIEKAKQLLKNSQVTLNNVFFEVGFNDPQYFSKTFKKYVGMTVTEYRAKQEKNN